MPRIAKQRRIGTEEHLQRARAASEATRKKLGLTATPNEDPEVSQRSLPWWRERWSDPAIRRLFIETFIKVRDPRQKQKLVPMRLNRMQAELHANKTGRDVCLKMRRGGMSTFWLAEYFADAVVLPGQSVRIVPHTPKAEKKLFADLKIMYRELPPHIKPATRYFSLELIEFYDTIKGTVDSRINTSSVQPGHEDMGRSEGFTHLLLTEVPFWRGDAKTAVLALIEAAQYGQIVLESTAQGVELFHQTYQQGKKRQGGWTSHFYPWWFREDLRQSGARFVGGSGGFLKSGKQVALLRGQERLVGKTWDEIAPFILTKRERAVAQLIFRYLRKQGELTGCGNDWIDDDVAEYIAWRRTKIEQIGERNFLVEFPENDRECFEQTGRAVISEQFLKVTCAAADAMESHAYLVAADVSLGLADGDPAAIQVIDLHTGRQCYEEELLLSPDLLAVKLADISDQYNYAAIVVERNGPGIATILKLVSLGYEDRLYKHLDARLRRKVEQDDLTIEQASEEAQYGFPTSAENKSLMGLRLEEAVRCGYLGLSSERFCEQAKTVVWKDDKSWGALSGYHDDLFMALAIGNFVMRYEADMLPAFTGVEPEGGELN